MFAGTLCRKPKRHCNVRRCAACLGLVTWLPHLWCRSRKPVHFLSTGLGSNDHQSQMPLTSATDSFLTNFCHWSLSGLPFALTLLLPLYEVQNCRSLSLYMALSVFRSCPLHSVYNWYCSLLTVQTIYIELFRIILWYDICITQSIVY